MKKVILAGVCLKDAVNEFESKMEECAALCEACNLDVAASIIQKSNSMDRHTAFRSGKLEELAALVAEKDADEVIFYNGLRVQVAERISEAVGCDVIDRTALILDIFSQRARSRQAKLQTEMARLQYDLPRLLNSDNDTERSRGGAVTNRGAGEMRSAIVARKYQARIQDLKEELKKIETRRTQDERRRSKTKLRRAALVGYTNAGKSSFMNALLKKAGAAGSDVFEKDMLFATLDTSVRMIEHDHRQFLLYDTVGFVSDLPHTLVEAFKSTLDAAREADLLIHVIDCSDPSFEKKIEVTEETLNEIGAGDIPIVRVYTKRDLAQSEYLPEGFCVSNLSGEGIEDAVHHIVTMLYPQEESAHCYLPYDKIGMFDAYKPVLNIEIIDQDEGGMTLRLSGPERYIHAFDAYRIEEKEK